MPNTLYKVPLPEATTEDERDDLGTVLAEQQVLDGDALVDALGSESADLSLSGEIAFGNYYSELVATELEEVADSSLRALPLFATDGSATRAGYYEVDSASVEPVHAAGRDIWEWSLDLTKKGTRKTHLQAVETSVSQPELGNEFGDETSALIALPAAARRVRAVDSKSSPTQRERPGPVETRDTEYGDVEVYDLNAIGIDDAVITYDVAYERQAPVDVHVYDSRGRDEKYIEGSEGRVRAWEAVFATDHEWSADAEAVLDNGLLRVRIDEPDDGDETARFKVEQWDPAEPTRLSGTGLYGDGLYGEGLYAGSSGDWVDVDLPVYPDSLSTDWKPVDVDITRIGRSRVAAQLEFEAVAGDDEGDVFVLDVELERGREELEIWLPSSVSEPIPDGLETLLEPIASTSGLDTGVSQTLVARDQVRL